MVMKTDGEVTQLLARVRTSEGVERKAAHDELVTLVYGDLRRRAQVLMRNERNWTSMQPTALVHETYGRMLGFEMDYEDRTHFLNVAATVMRRILVDRARSRSRLKRGGGVVKESLDDHSALQAAEQSPDALLDLDAALQKLRPHQVRLVELRYFLGLTLPEISEATGINVETLKKRWRATRLILHEALAPKRRSAGA